MVGPEQRVYRHLLGKVRWRGGQFGDAVLVEQLHGLQVGGAVVDMFGEAFLLRGVEREGNELAGLLLA